MSLSEVDQSAYTQYFTLSGLNTDLTLLNDGASIDDFMLYHPITRKHVGKKWGYTFAIIVTAFVGKFGGCTVASRYVAGFNWRESSAIGSLMSCKGLVIRSQGCLFMLNLRSFR